MKRIGGPALLASLGLALLAGLRIRELRVAGPACEVGPAECVFTVDDPSLRSGYVFLPDPAVPAGLGRFSLRGVKGDSDLVFELNVPPELRPHAVVDAPVELRHAWLDLPFAGPVAGRTVVSVGHATWRQAPWRLWGATAAVAAAPVLLWLLAALPWAILREKRSPPPLSRL